MPNDRQSGTPREYPATLEANDTPPHVALERAIQLLAPGASNPAIASRLLEARTSRENVRDWRRGRVGFPQWVIDMLRAKLEARARPILEACATLERSAPIVKDRGAYGTRALRRWRLSQKQKPGL